MMKKYYQGKISDKSKLVIAWNMSLFGILLVRRIFPYSVRMRENADQKNSLSVFSADARKCRPEKQFEKIHRSTFQ